MQRSTFITWDQLRVGAFIAAAIAVLVFAVVKLGNAARLFGSRYTLVAFLPNAAGLRVGGQVTVAGQLAGNITSIDFLPIDNDTSRNLRILVEIDDRLKEQVRADSWVNLRTQGLLGDRFFDITPGTPAAPILQAWDTLQVNEAVDYDAMMRRASAVLADVMALTHDFRIVTTALMEGKGTMGQLLTNRALYDRLNGLLSQTTSLLTRLQNPNGSMGRLLDDPALYENLVQMVGQADSLLAEFSSGSGSIGKLLRDDSLYTRLDRITANADTFTTNMKLGEGTAAKLFTDDSLYQALLQSVEQLNQILADIKRNPGRYTKGAVKVF